MSNKISYAILIAILLVSTDVTSYAMTDSKGTKCSDVIVIREDIPYEEAKQDNSYDAACSNQSSTSDISTLSTNEVYWDVWGSYDAYYEDGVYGAVPLGYSAHKSGDTVLDTYHYTRTYLGSIVKSGDSGRCWGNGTVEARGTFCDEGVWDAHRHYVKYGTESD